MKIIDQICGMAESNRFTLLGKAEAKLEIFIAERLGKEMKENAKFAKLNEVRQKTLRFRVFRPFSRVSRSLSKKCHDISKEISIYPFYPRDPRAMFP